MFRLLPVSLVIIGVLVCPLACAGVLAGQHLPAEVNGMARSCGCGHESGGSTNPLAPPIPCGDDCRDCVCQGVLESPNKPLEELVDIWKVLHTSTPLDRPTSSVDVAACEFSEDCGRPSQASGAGLRLTLASLLL